MSKIICSGCGAWMEDTSEFCSVCGAENPNRKKAGKKPQSIVQLKKWYELNRGVLTYQNCVFGTKSAHPGAIGIYKKDDKCYVYKNDLSGRSAIMYTGDDEEYAVDYMYAEMTNKIAKRQEADAYFLSKINIKENVEDLRKYIIGIVVELIVIFILTLLR